jgi:alginate O-acetyltransferase complex protein AlgI
MSFISFSFLFLFVLVLVGRFFIGPTKVEKPYLLLLLVASLVFYASFVPQYLLLLLFTTLVDYYAGLKIAESASAARRKTFLVVSLAVNLGLLGFFKYSNFALDWARNVCLLLGIAETWVPRMEWVLPIGISFFTFQSMSYTIDIFRDQLKPVQSYWRFLLFVSFFTHLISGPIVRASELLYQFDRKRQIRLRVCLQGCYLMVLGFFLKMVVADNLAAFVNRYWERGAAVDMPAPVPLVLAFLFSCQIFADFFGYTNIALGTAYLLGFKLPTNFNNPYIAGSFREFWTRWHITLSRWIRDYLYIPLGGNQGSSGRVFYTLMTTMLLAGLWHGAAPTFILWGGIHGLALALERFLGFHRMDSSRPFLLRMGWFLVVQATVLIAWIFFRSRNLEQGYHFLKNIVTVGGGWEYVLQIAPAFWFVLPIVLMHLRGFLAERQWMEAPGVKEKGILCGLMLYALFTLYGKNNAFIYFQF